MSNNYFRFKQFTIFQDGCAMKVGTDGCLLGGWFCCKESKRVLDIGCGSGLIAIMAAQRCNARVSGIEIDPQAAEQARKNVADSPWRERIDIANGDFLEFNPNELFDTIVSNPPYFVNSLKCDDSSRTLARHSDSLGSFDFFEKAGKLLTPNGKISIIIPYDILEEWQKSAKENRFSTTRLTYIKTTPRKAAKRVLAEFSRDTTNKECKENILILEESPGCYTADAKEILQDFYIKL